MAAELLRDLSRASDANNSPLSGAKWYFYATGTTTPQAVYTDAALTTPHANPVVADSGGKFAPIYFDADLVYRGILRDADEAEIADIDPINEGILSTIGSTDGAKGSALVGRRSTVNATPFLSTTSDLLNGLEVPVLVNVPSAQHASILAGTSTYDASSDIQELIDACGTNGATLKFPPGNIELGSGLTVTNKSSIRFQGQSSKYRAGTNVSMSSGSTDKVIFDLVGSSDITLSDMTIMGRSPSESGHYLFEATDESGDLDLTIQNCHLGNVETIGRTFGRGLTVQNSQLVLCTNGFVLDWPSTFTPGPNTDQTAESGMRAFRFEDIRCHAWSGGRFITNNGSNASNFRGALVNGLFCDTNMMLWDGVMNHSVLTGIKMLHTAAATYVFDSDDTENVTIQGLFQGQNDPAPTVRNMDRFGIFRNCENFKLDAIIDRVAEHCVVISGGSNIDLNIQCSDVSLDGSSFYPVLLSGAIDNIRVRGGVSTTGSSNEFLSAAGATVTGVVDVKDIRLASGWTNPMDGDVSAGTGIINPENWTSLGSVADDAVATFTLPERIGGRFEVYIESNTQPALAQISYHWDGANSAMTMSQDDHSRFTDASPTVLTGTDGTDVKVNLSIADDGTTCTFYVENRLGTSITPRWRWVYGG